MSLPQYVQMALDSFQDTLRDQDSIDADISVARDRLIDEIEDALDDARREGREEGVETHA